MTWRRASLVPSFIVIGCRAGLMSGLMTACATEKPPPREPEPPPVEAAPPASSTSVGGSARPAPPPLLPLGPGDSWPDPSPPQIECVWRPRIRCVGSATPAPAAIPAPYEGCAKDIPVTAELRFPEQLAAQFSPKSTRAARQAGATATCCYVEYTQGPCR